MNQIISKNGEEFCFRRLTESDSENLGNYFENLSEETRKKFQPHPLTKNYAIYLCHKSLENAMRFVISDQDKNIHGYFILDFDIVDHEAERYHSYGIELTGGNDAFFAPSVADDLQNSGLASQSMEIIMDLLKDETVNRLVLLGGTREDNPLALSFYEKFGFEKVGGYQTDIWNFDMQLTV